MAFHVGGDATADDEVLSEINVTPLVDVMLVLLIIFMIATPMLHQGVEVALPQVASENLPLRNEDPMVITVTKEELVYLKNEPVHPSQLVERLRPVMEGRQDESVFIKGDRDAPYGAVLRVIDIINAAGTYRIGLVTEPVPAS
ncbi:MAG TPA: ExbD/TolR family protein [Thermoanaerobaculia bacterium]|nr:ExbD/TolR family protein [Thermoanaerobaculia bacterium]